MTQVLVMPKAVFESYKTAGVQFNKLLDANYIVSETSVNDLAEIHQALTAFPFLLPEKLDIKLAVSPIIKVAELGEIDGPEQFKMKDLHNRLESRLATNELRDAGNRNLVYDYYLYPVDENLWVAVQQSAHIASSDPRRVSIQLNHTFFDSMINEMLNTRPRESVASTQIFTYYLESC
ncbi:hypothetical protein RVBP15_0620 [Pseudomonas phage sp. 30-1]|nr:hypothetical protein RVBP15_0620 [Pseudomonas phage sp. 30-1]